MNQCRNRFVWINLRYSFTPNEGKQKANANAKGTGFFLWWLFADFCGTIDRLKYSYLRISISCSLSLDVYRSLGCWGHWLVSLLCEGIGCSGNSTRECYMLHPPEAQHHVQQHTDGIHGTTLITATALPIATTIPTATTLPVPTTLTIATTLNNNNRVLQKNGWNGSRGTRAPKYVIVDIYHWQIQGALEPSLSLCPISFIFMQFSANILPNKRLALLSLGWPTDLLEILDPPLRSHTTKNALATTIATNVPSYQLNGKQKARENETKHSLLSF